MTDDQKTLKTRFLEAVLKGELGTVNERGTFVSLKEFKAYFSDIKTQYVASFMPAATIERGRYELSHTKFLFRVESGLYQIHPQLLHQLRLQNKQSPSGK